jgi:hypothetical protein
MRWFLSVMFGLFVLAGSGTSLPAATPYDDSLTVEVRKDVEATLDLWRDGRYEDVYRRCVESGRHSKEYFINHMAAAPRRPACCWEKLQDVNVTLKGDRRATLKARFGFDTGTGTEFITKSVKLQRDDGIWKVVMSDLLTLSGTSKKVRGKKKK